MPFYGTLKRQLDDVIRS